MVMQLRMFQPVLYQEVSDIVLREAELWRYL